jgi:hypothetical protein
MKRLILVSIAVVAMVACGKKGGGTTDGGDGDDGGGSGVDGLPFDAFTPPNCTGGPDPSKPQCSNCIDDDGDGFIDGFDINCTGPADNDESSFKTGIPGDNIDPKNQDCFFDGDSGAGNDGCNVQTCCLLGITVKADCPQALGGNVYDPTKCPPPIGNVPLSQQCIDFCQPVTAPGCDCFGCCTLCDAVTNQCFDIEINPNVSPNCTAQTLADPTKCVTCVKQTTCGQQCGGTTCILCPGQDPGDLPPECNGTTECPGNEPSCQTDACPTGTYCQNGCCITIIM